MDNTIEKTIRVEVQFVSRDGVAVAMDYAAHFVAAVAGLGEKKDIYYSSECVNVVKFGAGECAQVKDNRVSFLFGITNTKGKRKIFAHVLKRLALHRKYAGHRGDKIADDNSGVYFTIWTINKEGRADAEIGYF